MKRISILLFALAVSSISFASTTSAQDATDNKPRLPQQAASQEPGGFTVISSLNIPSAVVTERKDRELTVSFVIKNEGEKVESGIRPGVSLFRILSNGDKGKVDQVFTDESFTLAAGEEVTREIKYTVPDAFRGEYAPGAIIANTAGLTLSETSGLETFTFEDLDGSLYVQECVLNVEGDAKDYNIASGRDFAPTENASITCSVVNNSQNTIPFTPIVSVYERALSGTLALSEKYATEQILASETRKVTFQIPKIQKPQAYEIRIDLVHDEFENVLSNPVLGHVVVQGSSATVQSITLDKKSYDKGETAKVTALVALQADYFVGGRKEGLNKQITQDSDTLKYTATTTITSNGKKCADPIKSDIGIGTLNNSSALEIEIPITAKCANTIASVEIASIGGENLANGNSSGLTGSGSDISNTASKAKSIPGVSALIKDDGGVKPVVLAVIIISLLTAIAILFMKKKSTIKILIPALILGSAMLSLSPNSANAWVIAATLNDGTNGDHVQGSHLGYNYLDENCEPKLTGRLTINNCGNPDNLATEADACSIIKVNGVEVRNDTVINQGTAPQFDLDAPLPVDRSSFDIELQFANHCKFYESVSVKTARETRNYTVTSCGLPTDCGFRGETLSSEPTNSQKCTNGGPVQDAVTTPTGWEWNCDATDGSGRVYGCSAVSSIPRVNGVCGDTNILNHPVEATGCAEGLYRNIPDTEADYVWRCEGSGPGGTSVQCNAPIPDPIDGECGIAETTPAVHTSFPTSHDELCNSGGKFEDKSNPDAYTWQCGGQYGGADSRVCSANRVASEDGACGTASSVTPVDTAPTTNLCANGDTPDLTHTGSRWIWICPGANGGQDSTQCEVLEADRPEAGTCGTAANPTPVPIAPSTNLCGNGASPVVSKVGTNWSWTCPGENGGLDSPICVAPVLSSVASCGADDEGTHLFAPPTQLCANPTDTVVGPTQNGDVWEWTCTGATGPAAQCSSTSNCPRDQYACGPNRCISISVDGSTQPNLNRDGSPVIHDQAISTEAGTPKECLPITCTINGQDVPLNSVPQGVQIVHGANAVECRVPTEAKCDERQDDPDCVSTREIEHQLSCVCQARRCSPSGTCTLQNVIASSYSSGACQDDCSACSGGGVDEPNLF